MSTNKPSLIRPSYPQEGLSIEEFEAFSTFIDSILRPILPPSFLKAIEQGNSQTEKNPDIALFYKNLPLIHWKMPKKTPATLSVSFVCHSDLTNGVGRYACDALAKWLAPGTSLSINSVRSLSYLFNNIEAPSCYFQQVLIHVTTPQQLHLINQNKDNLEKEMRLTILAVRYSRQIVSATRLSHDQKKALIEENIASHITSEDPEKRTSLFEHIHKLWIHLSAEEKIQQLQDQFPPFMQRHRSFDRSIFDEIKHSILILKNSFTAMRDIRHVSRLISYQYLFRKTLMRKILQHPQERHLSLKLLKNQIFSSELPTNKNTIGIFGAMNLIRDNELFEEKHLIEAITFCLPSAIPVPDSLILDRKSHDPLRFFYIEIQKENAAPFTPHEIQTLKKDLPRELKEGIESILPPILMQRNEEEILRNTLLLAEQLKYVKDLPQVIISFNGQTELSLEFTVVLLRVLKEEDLPLSHLFSAYSGDLEIEMIETKRAGLLRKRYPKEANIFKVNIPKSAFLRRDFTIDLIKARQKVSAELHYIFNGIRDFNGGILLKQQETFQQLKDMLYSQFLNDRETPVPPANKDFLLENFFYSITPPLRQTLISPSDLKYLFLLMEEALDKDYKEEPFFLKAVRKDQRLLVMVASSAPWLKERLNTLLTKLKIPTTALSSTYVTTYGIHTLGYIYQNKDPTMLDLFYSTLSSHLQEWHALTTA